MKKKDREVIEAKRNEYQEFFDECFNNAVPGPNGDRAMAILGAAFLDERLHHLLENFMLEDETSKDLLEKLDFSLRIELSYVLGLIGPDMKSDLNHIRTIRNSFAHHLHGRCFEDSDIKDRCTELRACDLPVKMLEEPRSRFATTVSALSGHIHLRAIYAKHCEPGKDFKAGQFIKVPAIES